MTAVENVSEPKREVILSHLRQKLLARAVQDQPSQTIRPQARGSDQLNLQIRLKERARRASFQKGKKGDYEKGKSKKGSSKGSTEKGKSKGKHYSKGKGQK